MVLATAAVVKVPIALVAPPKFKVCKALPPLMSSVPAPLKLPVTLTVLAVVPKSKVPALIVKLPPIVALPCKVFTPLPEIVKFL